MVTSEADIHGLAGSELAIKPDGLQDGPSNADDADLGRQNKGAQVGAPDDADIAQRDSSATDIACAKPALLGQVPQPVELSLHFEHGQRVDSLDVGHREAVGRVHRDREVVAALERVLERALRVVERV